MPIIVDRSTRVLYQGIGGEEGIFDLQQSLAYGTHIVGLVDSEYESKELFGLPVFSTVQEALRQTRATVSMVREQPSCASDAILEAEDSGIEWIICERDSLPEQDMVEVYRTIKRNRRSRLLGPGSFGAITPEQSKVGRMPGYIFSPGPVGVISSAETLAYEAVWQMTRCHVGQSTCVGVGDKWGVSFSDLLSLFEKDSRTDALLLIAFFEEMEEVISWAKKNRHKPLIAYIAGGSKGLQHSGITVIEDLSKIGETVHNLLKKS